MAGGALGPPIEELAVPPFGLRGALGEELSESSPRSRCSTSVMLRRATTSDLWPKLVHGHARGIHATTSWTRVDAMLRTIASAA